MSRKKIGIMGGTFDPIHNGHLILAEYSRIHFELDEVLFIPTGNPPHKDENHMSAGRHRYDLTLLAINTNPKFKVSAIEVEVQGTTYSVDTIQKLQKEDPEVDFYFILGSDSFYNIHGWKDYKQLIGLCKFIVLKRPCEEEEKLEDRVREFNKEHGSLFYVLEAPLIEISSTDIRDRVKKGLSIRYLVPEGVGHYIKRKGLYKGEGRCD